MALDEQTILRRTQTFSAPARRALSEGLQQALLETRYYDNPNVAALVTRKALQGYGAGLSSAISTGEQQALSYGLGEENLNINAERLNLEREQLSNANEAATISGITQLGLLGLTGYDIYKKWGGAASTLPSTTTPPATTTPAVSGVTTNLSGDVVGEVTRDMAISGVTGQVLTGSQGAIQIGAPATLGEAYSAISGTGAYAGEMVGAETASSVAQTTQLTGLTSTASLGVLAPLAAAIFSSKIEPVLATNVVNPINKAFGLGGKDWPSASEYVAAYNKGLDYVPGFEDKTTGLQSVDPAVLADWQKQVAAVNYNQPFTQQAVIDNPYLELYNTAH